MFALWLRSDSVPYNQSKDRQKLLRKNAALQLAELISRFHDWCKTPKEAVKYGTELEAHLLNKVTLNGKHVYVISPTNSSCIEENNAKNSDEFILGF